MKRTLNRLPSTVAPLTGLCLYSLAADAQTGPFLYVPKAASSDISVVDTSNNATPFAPIAVGPGIAVAVKGRRVLQVQPTPGPIFTGGTLQFVGPNITSSLPITLETDGGTFDTLANTATLSGTISGPGALTKIGTGTLILTGDNTYDGGTIISTGTLQLGSKP